MGERERGREREICELGRSVSIFRGEDTSKY
jgi:hypothetical protein